MKIKPWHGDWDERIYGYAREKGYERLTNYAEAQPHATYKELATALGEGVAPVQVETLLREEALAEGAFPRFARSGLVRNLRSYVSDGWGVAPDAGFRASRAFANWMTMLGETYEQAAEHTWEILKKTPPPRGWLPTGPEDPLLLSAFRQSDFLWRTLAQPDHD